ncbi:MAG: ABC transporter substrate-binding protein [Halobellus sp.]|uniref:ABC transporter substrate-binding protein n=1 Tax=Halobellus sp. TaxID=1979212 RepID=UPI0035D4C11E
MSQQSDLRDRVSRRSFLRAGGVAVAAAFAGCTQSDSGGTGDSTTTTGDGGTETMGGTTTGTAQKSGTTITFWPAWGGYYESTFSKMISNFESEYPDITVDWSAQGSYAESRSAVFTAAKAGNAPDIAHLGKNATILARDTGFFTPIGGLMPDLNLSEYVGAGRAWSTVEGSTWSLPFNNSQILLYYNKNHFREAGLDPEQPPRTFEEVRQYSQQIVDQGVADSGISWPNVNWWPMSWMAEQGQVYFNKKNGREGEPTKTYFDSDAARTLYQWWMNDLGDLYHYPGKSNWGASEKAFSQGNVSMHMNSTGGLAYLLGGFRDQGIEIGVGRLPTPSREHNGHAAGGAQVWVSKKDNRTEAERDAIRKFLRNMTGPKQQALYSKATGYFPAHTGSISRLEEQGFLQENPLYQTAFDQLEAWSSGPATSGVFSGTLPRTATAVVNETDNMWQGKSVDQALSDLDSKTEEQLEFYERRDI